MRKTKIQEVETLIFRNLDQALAAAQEFESDNDERIQLSNVDNFSELVLTVFNSETETEEEFLITVKKKVG